MPDTKNITHTAMSVFISFCHPHVYCTDTECDECEWQNRKRVFHPWIFSLARVNNDIRFHGTLTIINSSTFQAPEKKKHFLRTLHWLLHGFLLPNEQNDQSLITIRYIEIQFSTQELARNIHIMAILIFRNWSFYALFLPPGP